MGLNFFIVSVRVSVSHLSCHLPPICTIGLIMGLRSVMLTFKSLDCNTLNPNINIQTLQTDLHAFA